MKTDRSFATLFAALGTLFLAVLPATAAPLSGTRSIGPTGDYASIGAAIADVQTQTLGGALVLELQPAYVSTVETFPLVFSNLTTTAANTLTLRPQTGAAGLAISSANTTAATVDLRGAQFATIDGRPGGAGAAKELTIANTSTAGVALRFINEASSNLVEYLTLQGVNTNGSVDGFSTFRSGVVFFSTTTGANGNDDNTIDHCDIRDGASTPVNGIYSLGTTTTAAQNNSGNTVSNCNVFNFYSGTTSVAGVRLDGGNTDWILTGNSFYQTSSRAAVGASVFPILISNTSGNNFTLTGNFIGGSAPSAGGTAWTTTGNTVPYGFVGIYLSVGSTTASSVQGNTIQNIVWTCSSTTTRLPGVWIGIYVTAGSANIGTVTGNTIGSGTGTGSVSVTDTPINFSIGTVFGISSKSSGTLAIANNTIGSITTNGSTTAFYASLIGIQVTAGANTISNNTVGSTTTANSLNAATSSTSSSTQQVTGILSSSNIGASITGNTVANLNNNYAGTTQTGQIRGIVTSAGVNTVTGNTVRNLSTTSQNTGPSGGDASTLGISQASGAAGQTVSQNTVHSLVNTAATAAVTVTGIYFTGPTTGTNVIARNLVHSLAVSSTSAASALNGMYFWTSNFTAQNNMIRVGLDATGTSTAGASSVRGIVENASGNRNYYHNSVYLGGTQTSGTTSTVAFQSSGSSSDSIQNNIFVNARSNSGATIKHYAVQYSGTTVNPTGLTADGNLFLASGTGGVLGLYNSADRTTLAAWQAATGKDATSAVADPLFIAPTGTAATVDLHLQPSNPAEGGGLPIAAVTDDFDGQTRSGLTPTDIGADAGNFTSSTGDIFAPGISYPLLPSGSTANRVLTGWATITDNSGSVASGASAPRLYYKKQTDADVFGAANNTTGNGWKYVTTTSSTSPYNFTIDYTLINGGSVTVGETIQYFVVAQDTANNLGSSPAAATASAAPPVQNLSAKPGAGVNSYTIRSTLSGTKTVGAGGDYSSLSGVGGLFAAINSSVLTGNIVVNITSDVTETGASGGLGQWLEEGAGNYTLTIQPDSATMRTFSGNVGGGLLTFYGTDRVIIDGRFGGTGRYLTFRNTFISSGASTLLFQNDASNNTVRSIIVEGASPSNTSGVIFFSTGTVTGNDNNLITDCQVRDLSTAAGLPRVLIGSNGSSAAVANSGNTISNNELFNFDNYGIVIYSPGNEGWTVSGNNIYEVNAATFAVVGIQMSGDGPNVIRGNSIHDLLTTKSQSYGIYFSGTSTTTISRNRITAFNVNAATSGIFGIYTIGGAGSTLNVVNNQISLSPATSGSANLYGIYDDGSTGSVVNVFYNSFVLGGTESGARSSWASLRTRATTHTARDNVFFNLRTGGIGHHFAVGSENSSGSYTVSNNVYAGTGATGATPASFMDFSASFTSAVTFATWQTSTGDTNSSAGIAGTVNFNAALFANAATGDLHLVPGGNTLVNALGTPIAGMTNDFDGDPRSATTPTIGSDEFVLPSIFATWAATYSVSNDPNVLGANGQKNAVNFAFGINPLTGGAGGLQYAGTFAGSGAITATGLPVTMVESAGNGVDFRALFVRRKNYAAEGVSYTPQFSADLATWTNSAAVPAVLADDGVNQIVSVPYPVFIAGKKARFFRISVTLAP